jgi:23S rRNA (adenine2503-C2)-methyltransferase
MTDIKELDLVALEKIFSQWGHSAFHARQVFSWVYKRGVTDFAQMSDLPAELRKRLKDNFYIVGLKVIEKLRSRDGTEKFLLESKDKNLIECVSIPAEGRLTGCISSQAGCRYACRFCASGLSGFKRNLSCGEILEQVLYLRPSHIVFMGTGEPLDNYDHVLKAIRIINSKEAFNIGARRITISTCGIIPAIKKLADEDLQIELSVSLHAADDKTRSLLVPLNTKYPLKDLIKTCAEYIKKTNRQITLEYVLIKGVNSGLPQARELSTIIKGLKLAKVNLIPVNPIKELRIEPPNKLEILFFKDYLLKAGINATLRKSRGGDINAACGQLRLKYAKV